MDAPPPSGGLLSRLRNFMNWKFFRSFVGGLKIVQNLVCLIALIIMASVANLTGSGISSIEFFIFAHTVIWVMILIVMLMHVCNIYSKLPKMLTANAILAGCSALAVLITLIASAAVMSKFNWNQTILAGGSFGLIAMFLFLFEAIYYFVKGRREGMFPVVAATATTSRSDESFGEPGQPSY